MSILVSLGANPNDVNQLQTAKDITKFVSSLMKAEDHSIIFADKNYTQAQLNSLTEWFDDILFILYNGGNLEDTPDLQTLDS